MNFRRFFDNLQLRLYLLGFSRLAHFVGQWSSPALSPVNPPPAPAPVPVEVRSGLGWKLDEISCDEPLRVIEFDPTFNNNVGIDAVTDLALPHTKLDIN